MRAAREMARNCAAFVFAHISRIGGDLKAKLNAGTITSVRLYVIAERRAVCQP